MMESYKTQKEMVLEYMRRHGSITTKECFEHLGITRLSAAIYLLKQDGYQIAKTGVTKKMPNGRNRYFEIFWIQRKPQ
jgi:hypothetical protein